jgi:hypothetical protein
MTDAATNKSLALANKSLDVGKATKKYSALRDASRAERAEFYFDPFCRLVPAVNGWGIFASMAATNKSLAQTNKTHHGIKATKWSLRPTMWLIPTTQNERTPASHVSPCGRGLYLGFNEQIFRGDEQNPGRGQSD